MPAYKNERTLKSGKKKVTWWARFYCNGKQIQKRGFNTKKEALEYEKEYLDSHVGSPDMLLKDFVDLFYRDKERDWKKTTLENYKSRIKQNILPFFGEMPLNSITYKDVRSWYQELDKRELKETTKNKISKTLSSLFNHAVKYYELKDNPCHKAGSIGTSKRKEVNFWTLEEYREFISHVDKLPYKVAFDTLYYTGLRIGELKALTLKDIDFSVPKIKVTKTCSSTGNEITTPKTSSSIRDVILPRKIANEILDLVNHYYDFSDTDLIFSYATYTYSNKLKEICKEWNLKPIRVHDLRHSHASWLINNGYDVLMVSERLGHSSPDITLKVYSHLFPSRQLELIDKLDSIIEK